MQERNRFSEKVSTNVKERKRMLDESSQGSRMDMVAGRRFCSKEIKGNYET